jgi:hypothetical protein
MLAHLLGEVRMEVLSYETVVWFLAGILQAQGGTNVLSRGSTH